VSTRDIKTSHVDTACDVCGRTLLRGERAEAYLDGSERRSVCELCKSRALHEGWIREGMVPAYDLGAGNSGGRRSLLHRLRLRTESRTRAVPQTARPTLNDELDGQAWQDALDPVTPEPVPAERPRRRRRPAADADPRTPRRPGPREPRHVRAVSTNSEHRAAEALALFNSSEHRRTIAGVARSLGSPTVAVLPASTRPSLVAVTVSWELCWYRYEVDLSDDQPSVRVVAQGYELEDLDPTERRANAASDEHGSLSLESNSIRP
jgi:hypothetical protein